MDPERDNRPTKRRKTTRAHARDQTTTAPPSPSSQHHICFTPDESLQPPTAPPPSSTEHDPAGTGTLPLFPSRARPRTYHAPLLLTSPDTRTSLLSWFTTVSSARNMPWRKPFTPPAQLTPAALSQRAYEVWISEVMLQQTRVQTVIAYWNRWMRTWPTIHDLARATEDEVLAVWTGLGYYSRAGRVWRAAREVCDDPDRKGLLPDSVEGLMALPGVGRYTAGAVASIVFGVAAPVVDGNVLRVLSRQLGVLGDVKGEKKVVEMLWEAAEELVRAVAADGEKEVSDRPGRWGQALMELGSTVCTPKPDCGRCPVTATCRAYAEGLALAKKTCVGKVSDIEDICTLCAPFEGDADGEDGEDTSEHRKQPGDKYDRLSRFFAAPASTKPTTAGAAAPADAHALETIINHARKFPLKKPKKKVREEEILVCGICRSSDGRYLIHRRPDKGLLAGLWELPSCPLPESNDSTVADRKKRAVAYAASQIGAGKLRGVKQSSVLKHKGELRSVAWLFSHLRLTMHVHLFEWDDTVSASSAGQKSRERWSSTGEIDAESMGMGMKRCWSLVRGK